MSAARPRLLIVIGVLLMASGLLLGVFALPSDAGSREDLGAARAVRALVSGDAESARAAMPADFASRLGYHPVLRQGLLVRPDGSCSSPLPLPDRFEGVCARHDLGYDLLRYAAVRDRPLGEWARVRIDDALAAGLRATCETSESTGCRLAASTAYLAVRANSVRQGDGVPGPETPVSVGAALLGSVGLLSVLVLPIVPLTRRVSRLLWRGATRARTLRLPAAPVLLLGGLAVSLSLVPSVLTRPAWLQGVLTGLLVAVTHPVGRLLARYTRGGPLDSRSARWAGIIVGVLSVLASAAWPVAGGQVLLDPTRSPGPGAGWLLVATVAAGLCAVLIGLGSLAARAARRWRRRLAPTPPVLGRLAAAGVPGLQRWQAGTLVLLALLVMVSGDPLVAAARAGLTSDVGARFFEAVGLDTAEKNVLSRPATRGAVRVYVGHEEASGPEARSRLAVRRLERLGGFERSNLVLAFPTGSGWVDPVGVRAVERRFEGDVATAAVQSTFLPSWAALLVAREDNEDGARQLVAAVADRLAQMPAAERPRLYLIGQSLGVLAATGVPEDSPGAAMVCGASWTGPPGGEIPRLPNPVVLANRDDPVVLWEPSLIWHRPASYPADLWLPGVSYLATGLDTIGSLSAPRGHGHRYGSEQGLLLPDCP